jgi:cyanobactin biosynthesis protein (PatB/AcyB/McaB family)
MISRQPIQAPPVRRPSLVIPHESVPLGNDGQRDHLHWTIQLMHSNNFNDPPQVGEDAYRKRGSI